MGQVQGLKPGQTVDVFFPCGLSLDEGVSRATKWWNEIGRIILKQAWEKAETAKDGEISKNDGIHRGLLFDQLNTREQHKVVMCWYQNSWKVNGV